MINILLPRDTFTVQLVFLTIVKKQTNYNTMLLGHLYVLYVLLYIFIERSVKQLVYIPKRVITLYLETN